MKKYPIWKAMYMSFYSADLYKDVRSNWQGIGFSYLITLSALVCIIISINFLITVHSLDIDRHADEITHKLFEDPDLTFEDNLNRVLNIFSQVPKITINRGIASTEESRPYFISDPITNNNLVIVDTTGEYNSLENTTALALLTKTRIILKKKENREEATYLSSLKEDKNIKENNLNTILDILYQIPLININNGLASIEEESPYYIYGMNNAEIAAIDTEGTLTSMDELNVSLLLTKDKLFMKHPIDGSIKELYISEINSDLIFEFLKTVMQSLRTIFTWMMPLLITPIFILAFFSFAVLKVLFLGLVCLILSKFIKLNDFRYSDALRLTSVAITPIIVFNFIIPPVFSNQEVIYFLIATGYVFFALKANSEQSVGV